MEGPELINHALPSVTTFDGFSSFFSRNFKTWRQRFWIVMLDQWTSGDREIHMKPIILIVAALSIVGCQDRRSTSPTAPTTGQTRPSNPQTGSNGRPETIVVGETFTSTVTADDPECDSDDPGFEDGALRAPCRTFQFVAPFSGTFVADLHWSNSQTYMELLTPSSGKCCSSPLKLLFSVVAGESYVFGVGFHGMNAERGPATAPFELTTRIER
jgi:hypothetical protein